MQTMKTFAKPAAVLSVIIAAFLLTALLPVNVFAGVSPELITTPEAFVKAAAKAEPGGSVLVGDIDFTPDTGIFNSSVRVSLDKNLTIQNGKKDGRAVFTGGSFILEGSKTAGRTLTCAFIGVVFDGGINGGALTDEDWQLPYNETEGVYTSNEPSKAQYAVCFRGNVNASFTDCDFNNYMHDYGGALFCRYGDYTQTLEIMEMFGDNSASLLDIRLDGCAFSGNSARYAGGAVYLEGNKQNVTFSAVNCVFNANQCGVSSFSPGGGAIYASGADVTLTGCEITGNAANRLYGGELPASDGTRGGGLLAQNASVKLTDCVVSGNRASLGGGVAVCYSNADFDGCAIFSNRAEATAADPSGGGGPWSNMSLGGGVFIDIANPYCVEFVNTEIYKNYALNGYGGVCCAYNNDYAAALPSGFGEVKLYFCTFADNVCGTLYDYEKEHFEWYEFPGETLDVPYVTSVGCVIIDERFDKELPRYETPGADNGYNYIASPKRTAQDGVTLVYPLSDSSARLSVSSAPGADWSVPDSVSGALLEGRYGGRLSGLHIGSNYSPELYEAEAGGKAAVYLIICGALLAVAAAASVILIIQKKNKALILNETHADAPAEPVPESASDAAPTVMSSEAIDELIGRCPDLASLSKREREILKMLLQGKKRETISEELFVTDSTVKAHIRHIYQKLGVSHRSELYKKLGIFQ